MRWLGAAAIVLKVVFTGGGGGAVEGDGSVIHSMGASCS